MDIRTAEIPENTIAVGIDVGSLFFKVVGLGPDGEAAFHHKEAPRGDAREALRRFLALPFLGNRRIGVSGPAAHDASYNAYDPLVCLHSAVRTRFPAARNILEVGASHLALIRLDDDGRIASIHRNSLCASGTGSFLDAQAARMGIDYHQEGCPARYDDPPSIATRCAVFAKSDLIYRQQEGVSKEALWSGLCRGLAASLIHALTRGRPLEGLTVLCGGVALNETLVGWLGQSLGEAPGLNELVVMPHPEFTVAYGAALLAQNGGSKPSMDSPFADITGTWKKRPGLRLVRSRYLESTALRTEKDHEGNEVTIHRRPGSPPAAGIVDVHLGVDIGSTSTKLVLVDADRRILLDIYRPTGADPIAAVWKLFNAVEEVSRGEGLRFNVRGAATTGSGRKLIGTLIGADLIINEISAHVAGAAHLDPAVETIFEIGGQDAKYMSVKNGGIVDANMNYVCAAGTGSFIEEQAAKLGYAVDEIGEAALGTSPPYTSTRCTVFMEQDILDLLNQGVSRREAAGAVMYSVIDNYLEQVVGRRPVNRQRVFFQGATARNRGLVAAIEGILGVEVVVSPFCHVLGAFGAALQAMQQVNGDHSRFRGFDLGKRSIVIEEETCGLCGNGCRLSRAIMEGEPDRPVWGMKCGREEKDAKRKELAEFSLFQKTIRLNAGKDGSEVPSASRPVVRLPRALTMHSDFVFWRAFFEALGISARLGPASSRRSLGLGRAISGPDFCLPLKAAVGQAAALLDEKNEDPIFIPFVLADYASPQFSQSRLCPYVEVLPALVRTALGGNGPDLRRLLSPLVDFRLPDRLNAQSLATALSPVFSIRPDDAERALRRAHEARRRLEETFVAEGLEALRRIREGGRPAVAVVGRPYSTMDAELNQDVPRTIARFGLETIPMTCLAGAADDLQGEFRNLFWSYGQRILSALCQIARTDGLYAVFLSNFGCGPDSFLLSYAEAVMGDKPFLILEIDEHGASGGYETRIEAWIEVIRRDWERKHQHRGRRQPLEEPSSASDLGKRTLWFPQMHPVGNRFFVSAFRSEGYDARTLPLEDASTFSLGKKWTRGAECLPMSLTLGAFLNQLESDRRSGGNHDKPPALFLPTSTGPCRFGQYRTLDRLIFERLDMDDIPILSPGAHNAYYGLPGRLRRRAWGGICGGDALFKMRCRILPYEITPGDTEDTLERWSRKAEVLIESNRMRWASFLAAAMADFLKIPVRREPRPLVGIVGEIYVRCNPFANSGVVNAVERLGGEAWLSPVSEWIVYTAWVERYLARKRKTGPLKSLPLALKWRYLTGTERAMLRRLGPLLGDRMEPSMEDIIRAGGPLLPQEFQGESIVTLGRAILFGEQGADLVINCAPFGCMHGNITSAVLEQTRDRTRAPVVDISYDGTGDNSILNAFMHEAWRRIG